MNLNKIAKEITLTEGKKSSVNIAVVKEILHILFTKYDIVEVIKMWIKYNKR